MKTLAEEWLFYQKLGKEYHKADNEMRVIKEAFYGGALLILASMTSKDRTQEEIVDMMIVYRDKIKAFHSSFSAKKSSQTSSK